MYTSNVKKPGKVVASTKNGKLIKMDQHGYVKKSNGCWREVY